MVELVEKQCTNREKECAVPVKSVDEAMLQNYRKGIVAGLRLAITQPAQRAAELQEQFNVMLEMERNNVS